MPLPSKRLMMSPRMTVPAAELFTTRPCAGARAGAVEFDERRGHEAGLCLTLDGDGSGDRGQCRGEVDSLNARAGDVELDGIGAGRRVGDEHGLSQRTGAGVGGGCDREGGRGESVFELHQGWGEPRLGRDGPQTLPRAKYPNTAANAANVIEMARRARTFRKSAPSGRTIGR